MELRTLELKIARSENLSVLPQVVSTVLKLADDPHSSPRQLEQIIQRDPAITAKILRVANSPFYGTSGANNIGRAISVLGINTMRSLVITVAYQQASMVKESCPKFSKLEFWRHSLAVATAARILAKLVLPARAEELHSAGMLHDVGVLAMDKFCPEDLDRAIVTAKCNKISLNAAIESACGYTANQVGVLLGAKWGLSDVMIEGIKNLDNPYASEGEYLKTTSILCAANALAFRAGFGNQSQYPDDGFDESVIEEVGVPEQQFEAICSVVALEVGRAETAFTIK